MPRKAKAKGAGDGPALTLPDVHVFAFGNRSYGFAAANLAASIRHHQTKDIRIVLHADEYATNQLRGEHRALFDEITGIPDDLFITNEILDPGKLKANIYGLLPAGDHLYLDADTMCIKDIVPLLEKLQADGRYYITEVVGKGTGEVEYTAWASATKQRQRLREENAVVYGIQTSWAFVRKVKEAEKFFSRVKHHHKHTWKMYDLDKQWGYSMPDELIYGYTCAEQDYDPSWSRDVMFFGSKLGPMNIGEIRDQYYFMSQYGGAGNHRVVRPHYLEMYDKEMIRVFRQRSMRHYFKQSLIEEGKYFR